MVVIDKPAIKRDKLFSALQAESKLDNNCYEDSYKRLQHALPLLGGTPLPDRSNNSRFGRIWGNLIRKDGAWLHFPKKYRGKGAPGALAMIGRAELIRGPAIWRGELRPGAILQGWEKPEYYTAVVNGIKPDGLLGHSFVFVEYIRRGEKIVGMRVADNNFHATKVIGKRYWAVLFAANTL